MQSTAPEFVKRGPCYCPFCGYEFDALAKSACAPHIYSAPCPECGEIGFIFPQRSNQQRSDEEVNDAE
jgi:hypothetical protein